MTTVAQFYVNIIPVYYSVVESSSSRVSYWRFMNAITRNGALYSEVSILISLGNLSIRYFYYLFVPVRHR